MATQLVFTVHGTPAPQGSKTRLANGAMVESSKAVRPWREAVRHAAQDAAAATMWQPPSVAALTVVFTIRRPASHYGTGRNAGRVKASAPAHPTTTPDLDKLVRATLDALADAGALSNDARVVSLYATKTYPAGHLDALDTPGAVIVLDGAP